ncbi:MAG: hypothetical protein EBZ69_00285 [Alphaproteobacteria bacterium]|nr:hypothetical protein [Alphaproteobacteria bacterium]
MGGDDEIAPDDLEATIRKVFIASFEYEHGFEASLIRALVDARHVLLCHENTSDDDDPPTLSSDEAEKWYLKCQKEMYVQAGCDEGYAEESASWPDALPLIADWDAQLLKDLARTDVAHHLVVMEQIRAEMEKEKAKENVNADS